MTLQRCICLSSPRCQHQGCPCYPGAGHAESQFSTAWAVPLCWAPASSLPFPIWLWQQWGFFGDQKHVDFAGTASDLKWKNISPPMHSLQLPCTFFSGAHCRPLQPQEIYRPQFVLWGGGGEVKVLQLAIYPTGHSSYLLTSYVYCCHQWVMSWSWSPIAALCRHRYPGLLSETKRKKVGTDREGKKFPYTPCIQNPQIKKCFLLPHWIDIMM